METNEQLSPKSFNIYCDESRVENLNSRKMVIGALLLPRQKNQLLLKK